MTTTHPQLVPGLRAVWRRSAEHAAEQLARFVRLTILAAMPSLIDLLKGGKFDYVTLVTFLLPFAEVAYRQVFPALGAAKADSAPGVAIVPSQVDPTAAPNVIYGDGISPDGKQWKNSRYPTVPPDDPGPDDAAEPQPIGDAAP